MNWLDILITVGLLWAGWSGLRRGLVREACRTGAVLLGLLSASYYAGPLSHSLEARVSLPPGLARVLSVCIFVLAVAALGYAIEPWVARWAHSRKTGKQLDRWGGLIIGMLKGAAITLLIVVGLSQIPWQVGHRALGNSSFGVRILQTAPAIYGGVLELLPGDHPTNTTGGATRW